uniref:Uncharacterized protein n=1 Tax=Ditylenchus dipsaci TaxID=166011 RepID=A0A915CWB9_9BILA
MWRPKASFKDPRRAVPISQAAVDEALLKFAVCSGQPMSIVGNTHFIDDDWTKSDFVLLFEPLPLGMTKTSNNVRFLVEEKLSEIGISAEDQRNLYITTDEGSNVDKLGGPNHVPCIH